MTDSLPLGWHHQPMLGFDLESTGVDVETDRIVQAATAVHDQYGIHVRQWLINPGVPIPEGATRIHGITDDVVSARGQAPAAAIGQVIAALHRGLLASMPVVIFNAAYDLTMLDREAIRHGLPTLTDLLDGDEPSPVIDPHVIDKKMSTRQGSRTLTLTCEHYGLPPAGEAHGAAVDTVMAIRLAIKLCEQYPQVANTDPKTLHKQQRTWRMAQMRSLKSYFTKSGQLVKAAGVHGGWPLLPRNSDGDAA